MKAGAATGTVNRELATLSHLFTQAEKWKWVRARPCTFSSFPENQGRIIALSNDQCEDLRQAALEDVDHDIWLFIEFALNTAMRHSEILQARFDQVDFERLRLFVPKAKAGQREQPITAELRDIILNEQGMRNDPNGWIFETPRPGASGTGHRHRMNSPFRRVVERAGMDITTITPHVMRHTAITFLVQGGVDLPTIQRISGHKTVAMVLRYTHVHGNHIDDAISVLGKSKEKIVSITPKLHKRSKK